MCASHGRLLSLSDYAATCQRTAIYEVLTCAHGTAEHAELYRHVTLVVVLQALNVLMLKILENSNRNYTFSALLALLLDTPTELMAGAAAAGGVQQAQMQQARWADLVVKCLIKSTKALPQVIEVCRLWMVSMQLFVGVHSSLNQDCFGRLHLVGHFPIRSYCLALRTRMSPHLCARVSFSGPVTRACMLCCLRRPLTCTRCFWPSTASLRPWV